MIQLLTKETLHKLFQAFSGSPYNKPLALFEQYFHEQQQGHREVYLSILQGSIIGYITLVWDSPYPAFFRLHVRWSRSPS
ncbi:MAG: hypothetical protein KGZ39_06495 [Simkania sp.]|nr:hypothetical protein [Simkania sp.]